MGECKVPSICVIGAGISGLSSAARILNDGRTANAKLTVIADNLSPNTVSDVAVGFWEPLLDSDTPRHLAYRWGTATWDHMMQLYRQGRSADIGITVTPGYYMSDSKETANENIKCLQEFKISSHHLPSDEVKQLFPLTYHKLNEVVSWTTVILRFERYSKYLTEIIESRKGVIVVDKTRLEDLEYDIVVNCTGLGAATFVGDTDMYPIRGQITRVFAPFVKHFISCSESNELGDFVHVHPGVDGEVLIGGTFIKGSWDTAVSKATKSRYMEGAEEIVPGVKFAKHLGDLVGLRPGREGGVRLETEFVVRGSHRLAVVHNYGHGRAGVTWHWGCAGDVAELVAGLVEQYPSWKGSTQTKGLEKL